MPFDKNINNDKLKEVINKVSENIIDIEYSEDLKERLKSI
jgi:hypothetical protein